MINFGKVTPGSTLYVPFDTFAGSTGASITMSGLLVGDIKIYKSGSVNERTSTTGFTLLDTDGIDFDGLTGIHGFSIDLSSNADSGFYTAGSSYFVVVSTITVDTQTVSFLAATFTIGYPGALLDTTIASLSTQTSFTLTAGPAEDDALNGCLVVIHDIASAVQMGIGLIQDYTGSTKTVTLVAGVTFAAAAGDNISILPPGLQPTTWGRTLDVSAAGEAGLDWANIGSPTASQPDVNVEKWNTTAVPAEHTAGYPIVTIKDGSGTGEIDTDSGKVLLQDGAITAVVIATDSIDSDAIAASAVTELQSGLATAAALAAVQTDTDDIQARLPAALVGGRIDANVGAISADSVAADNLETMLDGTGGQVLSLKQLSITNNSGPAISAQSTGSNGDGMLLAGHGTGHGLSATGGNTSGSGVSAAGGGTGGAGIVAAGATNGAGISSVGVGTGDGIKSQSFGTGHGLNAIGGSTSGDGIHAVALTSGDGIEATGAGAGFDINADIQGNISGTVNANVTQLSGDATAADNAESFFDGTGYAGTNNVIPTVTTVTDKIGYSLSPAGVQAIWDALTSGLTTIGSIGKAIVDFIAGGGGGGLTAADVWSYARRTLTQSAASVYDAVVGKEITVYRGTTWSISLTGLGDLSNYTTIYFSAKKNYGDPDSQAVVRVKDDANGLERVNGHDPIAATNGSITVDDITAGDITIVVAAVETQQMPLLNDKHYDVKGIDSASGEVVMISDGKDKFNIRGDVTRAVA